MWMMERWFLWGDSCSRVVDFILTSEDAVDPIRSRSVGECAVAMSSAQSSDRQVGLCMTRPRIRERRTAASRFSFELAVEETSATLMICILRAVRVGRNFE